MCHPVSCHPYHVYQTQNIHDSKVHGANMGPIWGRQDPDGPHLGPMNFALWDGIPSNWHSLDIICRRSMNQNTLLSKLYWTIRNWLRLRCKSQNSLKPPCEIQYMQRNAHTICIYYVLSWLDGNHSPIAFSVNSLILEQSHGTTAPVPVEEPWKLRSVWSLMMDLKT